MPSLKIAMTKSFAIKQQLYVSRSEQAEDAIREVQSAHVDFVSDDIAITLANTENRTIEDQFVDYQSNLERLSESFVKNEVRGSIVLSISIRAYTYIPEISFPGALVDALSRLGASVDVDVINMVESAQEK